MQSAPLPSPFDLPAMAFSKTTVVMKPSVVDDGFVAGHLWGSCDRIIAGEEGSGNEVGLPVKKLHLHCLSNAGCLTCGACPFQPPPLYVDFFLPGKMRRRLPSCH